MTESQAHCLVGGRLFPSTLAIDDPCVNDELALPAISLNGTGDFPAHRELEIAGAYAKRITEKTAVMVERGWMRHTSPYGVFSGLGSVVTAFKYQFLTLPDPELVISAGFVTEWGGTGRQTLEAPRFNVYTPTLYFGKGLGDLPFSLNYLRPFAITGEVGYAMPGWTRSVNYKFEDDVWSREIDRHPQVLNWGLTLQYSFVYMRQHVHDFDMPEFFNKLIPLVEFKFATPMANTSTSGRETLGSINPGIIYAEKAYQIGLEASVPMNRRSGKGLGVQAQVHFILDEILPASVTKPIVDHLP